VESFSLLLMNKTKKEIKYNRMEYLKASNDYSDGQSLLSILGTNGNKMGGNSQQGDYWRKLHEWVSLIRENDVTPRRNVR
jgi:hypothetical protein